jgi:U3 small nucleolar ribonucleoprotein protein LCP5
MTAIVSSNDVLSSSIPSTLAALQETLGKLQTSVVPAVETLLTSSVSSSATAATAALTTSSTTTTLGLDFLHVKNSVMLSYLIELMVHLRDHHHSNDGQQQEQQQQQQHNHRLLEITTVLDKIRGLDKKLRYQIDKLLALSTTTATSFVSGRMLDDDVDNDNDNDEKMKQYQRKASLVGSATNAMEDDPLQFRPDPKSFFKSTNTSDDDDNCDDDDDDDSGHANAHVSKTRINKHASSNDYDDSDQDDDDDDLAVARQTLAFSSQTTKQNSRKSSKRSMSIDKEEDSDDKDGDQNKKNGSGSGEKEQDDAAVVEVYRAPRLTAVPYHKDDREGAQEREQQRRRRQSRFLRTSELAQTLRDRYGETPDQEDIHGGGTSDLYGKQRAATNKLRQLESERTEYEEGAMIRLMTSRKERKERKRIKRMMEGGSNLAQMANLGNLVRETEEFSRKDPFNNNDDDEDVARTKALQEFYQSHRNSNKGGAGVTSSTNTHRHANGKRKRRPKM